MFSSIFAVLGALSFSTEHIIIGFIFVIIGFVIGITRREFKFNRLTICTITLLSAPFLTLIISAGFSAHHTYQREVNGNIDVATELLSNTTIKELRNGSVKVEPDLLAGHTWKYYKQKVSLEGSLAKYKHYSSESKESKIFNNGRPISKIKLLSNGITFSYVHLGKIDKKIMIGNRIKVYGYVTTLPNTNTFTVVGKTFDILERKYNFKK